MSIFITRCATCLILLVAVPAALLGQTNMGQPAMGQTPLGQNPEAILHAQGGVWVNGSEARDSSAVFSGDEIETKAGFSATLNIEGSTVLIQPESVGKLEDNLLALDHGSVSVTTSKNFKVRVKCLTVVPVSEAWTQYDVTDVNGTIQVAARKSDVNVEHEGSHKSTTANSDPQNGSVHEGDQKNYSEADVCGVEKRKTPASLTPEWIAGAAAGTGLLIWLLVHGGPPAQPMSNATP